MSHGAQRLTFLQGQTALDELINAKVGLDSRSLPHLDLHLAHAAGERPAEYFDGSVKAELDALGFNVSLLEGLEEATEETRQFRRAALLAPAEGM